MAEQREPIMAANLSFEMAMEQTQSLLDRYAVGELGDIALQQAIAALVTSENGARGFFVVYLSDTQAPAPPPAPVLSALALAPTVVAPLLIKNLAMSTAMAIAHRRNQNESLAQGSDRVQQRSLHLIQQLATPELTTAAIALNASLTDETGEYAPFLARWNYDPEQRHAIHTILTQTGLL